MDNAKLEKLIIKKLNEARALFDLRTDFSDRDFLFEGALVTALSAMKVRVEDKKEAE